MDLRAWIAADHDQLLFNYQVTAGLVPAERWSERPSTGANPIAWLVWHMARWEDIAVNVMVRDVPTVFDGEWADRLRLCPAPGTGFDSDEVDGLAEAADPVALGAYWHAVHDETRHWIATTADDELGRCLDAPVDSDERYDRYRAGDALLPDAAAWIRDFQRGKNGEFFLRWVALGHANWHFGELMTVTTALGHPVG